MTKLTLEDVAADCDNRPVLYGLSSVAHLRYAALCRSAQAVIEAAKEWSNTVANPRSSFASEVVCFKRTAEALAAHAKNEQGTGE